MPPSLWIAAVALVATVAVWPAGPIGRRLPWSWLLVAVAASCHVLAYDALRDDAFISLRYADHLVRGEGLVFNPGEYVEGYSNFLFVVLVAGLHALLGVDLAAAAIAIGYAATFACVLGCVSYFRTAGSDARYGLLAAIVVAGSAAFAAHGAAGMETSLFAAAVVWVLRAARTLRPSVCGALAGLATMVRPDGVILFGALAAAALCGSARVPRLVGVTVGFAGVVGPWTIWRMWYYGYLVPNQIVAKSGMDLDWQLWLGLRYVAHAGLLQLGSIALALSVVALAIVGRRTVTARVTSADVAALVALAGFVAFPIATGGDWMPAARFLVPAIAVFALVAARALELADHGAGRRLAVWFAVCAVATGAQGAIAVWPVVRDQNRVVDGEIEIGRWLGRRLPAGTLTAAWANGAIPFYSGARTIDMLGLTDEAIARRGSRQRRGHPGHVAFDVGYVVGRRPEVITFLGGAGLDSAPRDWLAEPACAGYRPHYTTVAYEFTIGGEARFANLWVRNDRVDELGAALADPDHAVRLVGTPPF